jgi:GNAT superfamily N-acetyltransferase
LSKQFSIRAARPEDTPSIYGLIKELAAFEKAPNELENTIQNLLEDGFGENPKYVCFVAVENDQVFGMSLCYDRYSTWKGKCLYLEDLVVTESKRGLGAGKALLDHTLDYAKSNNYFRVQWQVLDWNESAINFYKSFNAHFDGEWINVGIDLK